MITSRQNRRLKDIRRLRRSKGDRALLEGEHLVLEALDLDLPLEEVVMTPELLASPAGSQLASRLAHRPLEVEASLFGSFADADSPQGVLAVALLARGGVATIPVVADGLYLYADGLQDPGNLGALARVAEATGVTGLALSPGTVHPNHPRALRASAGSLLRLPVALDVQPEALSAHLGPVAPRWTCLTTRGGQGLWEADLGGCLVFAVGAEGRGLRPALEAAAELRLTIPLTPPVESLNATVAAAVTLFEVRPRRAAVATLLRPLAPP